MIYTTFYTESVRLDIKSNTFYINRVEETFLVCPSHCTVRTEPYTALHL